MHRVPLAPRVGPEATGPQKNTAPWYFQKGSTKPGHVQVLRDEKADLVGLTKAATVLLLLVLSQVNYT